jgi:radical SAM superfamily enzyme YgiQ (UPF0313 family)
MSTKTVKIKLISPKMSLRPMDSEFKRVMSPSLSLVTVASLTPEPHQVYIEDENVGNLNLDDYPDLVGINVNVDTSERAFKIADRYRQRGIRVVLGGIHASANAEEMLDHCDAVLVGEAEEVWSTLIDDLISGNLKKVYMADRVTDLGKVPIPNWTLIDRKKYLYHNIVAASRGCPFKCEFCYNSSEYVNSPFRNRPIENVINEILTLGTRQVMFIDDNFIGNVNWTKEFVEKMRPYNLIWHAAVSANLIHHKDLIDAFSRSGCKSLFIGFESINRESIGSVGKKQNKVGDYEELITTLHSHGIMVNASLVFGFDHDEPSLFQETLNWLVRNRIETMTAHILTPYPGTILHLRLEDENRITDFNLRKYNTSNVVFRPRRMTPDELREGYEWIYREFYSLKNILKRKPENRSLLAPYFLFNFGYRKYGKITALFGKLGLMEAIGKLGRKVSYGIDYEGVERDIRLSFEATTGRYTWGTAQILLLGKCGQMEKIENTVYPLPVLP